MIGPTYCRYISIATGFYLSRGNSIFSFGHMKPENVFFPVREHWMRVPRVMTGWQSTIGFHVSQVVLSDALTDSNVSCDMFRVQLKWRVWPELWEIATKLLTTTPDRTAKTEHVSSPGQFKSQISTILTLYSRWQSDALICKLSNTGTTTAKGRNTQVRPPLLPPLPELRNILRQPESVLTGLGERWFPCQRVD